jgi:hypothetical protein
VLVWKACLLDGMNQSLKSRRPSYIQQGLENPLFRLMPMLCKQHGLCLVLMSLSILPEGTPH